MGSRLGKLGLSPLGLELEIELDILLKGQVNVSI
jgi:hypothetical protein